jgi:hypothetical protein
MIQAINQIDGVDRQTVNVIGAFRKPNNVVDYSGNIVPLSALEECVSQHGLC